VTEAGTAHPDDPAGAPEDGPGAAAGSQRASRRPRPQEARLAPEAIAAARGDAREGLVWLGRPPETRASLLYRALRLLARAGFFGVFRFRVETSGQELVPTGGYLLVAAVHRGWMDPFLVQHALPVEPRVWFLGSAPTAFSSRWREALLHRVGGMLPVWRGGVGIEQHVASAEAVLAAGGVFVLMAEGGIPGPPDRLAPFRSGSALIAIRTGAPIVPLAIVGSKELYIGRRMATRVLAPTSAAALLGDSFGGEPPERGSRAELDLAHLLTERLVALLEPVVTELYPRTVDPPERPRRLRGLTWLFIARPKATRDRQEAE
jgi:1-acyl-sn-glycerol-3-phosphate acyltransferase